jgi:hypothetical protein
MKFGIPRRPKKYSQSESEENYKKSSKSWIFKTEKPSTNGILGEFGMSYLKE